MRMVRWSTGVSLLEDRRIEGGTDSDAYEKGVIVRAREKKRWNRTHQNRRQIEDGVEFKRSTGRPKLRCK